MLFLLTGLVQTQAQFKNKATLQTPDSTGFYSIEFTPAISGFVKTDLSDIRILDEQQKQVPFIIRNAAMRKIDNRFDTLSVLQNRIDDSGRSVIVVQNKGTEKLDGFTLVIKNADVLRSASLMGSDDEKSWYSIIENIYFSNASSVEKDDYLQQINFPLSGYHFYKIVINNGKNAPLNITSVIKSITEETKAIDPYVSNPALSFSQKDSTDGYSYILVENPSGYHIERLDVDVTGPKFFKRELAIEAGISNYLYTVKADSNHSFIVPVFNDKKWTIKIYNGDNPPLVVAALKTFQSRKQLIASLDAGKKYALYMNDSAAKAPSYELQNFKDSIPQIVKIIAVGSIEKNITEATKKVEASKKWLWITLVVVLIVLAFFTVRLVKDVQKKN
ncbi:hypothetical protein [Pinibacter aurantiacus]|uniref:DUF3999 domain-containing protein n=1 Tax=Pinibacter aurantiacus TaxID=2851599 RepID=A0A9E2W3B7_9BACT|nr:hypothetical protein [Pinibacter aurantiacus]MBV4356073.1 hypothetical protein [Pinibacter aurantiacus]